MTSTPPNGIHMIHTEARSSATCTLTSSPHYTLYVIIVTNGYFRIHFCIICTMVHWEFCWCKYNWV